MIQLAIENAHLMHKADKKTNRQKLRAQHACCGTGSGTASDRVQHHIRHNCPIILQSSGCTLYWEATLVCGACDACAVAGVDVPVRAELGSFLQLV